MQSKQAQLRNKVVVHCSTWLNEIKRYLEKKKSSKVTAEFHFDGALPLQCSMSSMAAAPLSAPFYLPFKAV